MPTQIRKGPCTALAVAAGAALWGGPAAVAQTASFNLIGIPTGFHDSHVTGLSADGRVAGGYLGGTIISQIDPAFTWTLAGGRIDVGQNPGFPNITHASGISGDGTTLIGTTRIQNGLYQGFRISNNTYQGLAPSPTYTQTFVYGSNNDGSIVAGSVSRPTSFTQPCRWVNGTPQQIPLANAGDVAGGFSGMSRDGSTYIGVSSGSTVNQREAYEWTPNGGWTHLPAPAGTVVPYDAVPYAVTPDGSVAVGSVRPLTAGNPELAVIWRGNQPTTLPSLHPGWGGGASSITDTAELVVGGGVDPTGATSVITLWSQQTGTILLTDYWHSRGLDVPAGWTLESAFISADGLSFGGAVRGPNQLDISGYVATIPAPASSYLVLGFGMFLSRRRR